MRYSDVIEQNTRPSRHVGSTLKVDKKSNVKCGKLKIRMPILFADRIIRSVYNSTHTRQHQAHVNLRRCAAATRYIANTAKPTVIVRMTSLSPGVQRQLPEDLRGASCS